MGGAIIYTRNNKQLHLFSVIKLLQFGTYSCTYDNWGVDAIAVESSKVDRRYDCEWRISGRDQPWVIDDDDKTFVRLARVTRILVAYVIINRQTELQLKHAFS